MIELYGLSARNDATEDKRMYEATDLVTSTQTLIYFFTYAKYLTRSYTD